MKAIVISRSGGPEVLKLEDREVPVPNDGEVLIRIHAAGVNRPDVYQRKGNYPPPPGASPDIPGLEVSGVIEHVGHNCHRWKAGDKVCALLTGGGYAEYCTVPEVQCLPIPASFSFEEAASLPETFFTVWSNVFERGGLLPEQSLLVHGGAGGIGATAIQLAKAWGATVYATAGSAEKCKFCEGLGATKAIDYTVENFRDKLADITNGKGVNVILDSVGGDYVQMNLDSLAVEGRLVMINFMHGDDVKVRMGAITRKRLTITGSTLRARDVRFKGELAVRLEKNVWPWLESGKVKPVLDKTFALKDAPDAHRLMESRSQMGKIVLTVL